ncbi:NADPH-dependent F420 reductase [Pyxidicoccus xibeiensis]|uniref:NADPH-dependent F420 reductase n=1 Tax=Pyxidicoccus xibeiensis TaxID=2906759 RepID=UPI0020A7EB12|nr:NAD(P)-binding domain-containing protein [Pyxidicoccus xibeiensis]MCP3142378.1 NAD(P)-binding domain-containing protein [Pyxidicoccus xibeiensis]
MKIAILGTGLVGETLGSKLVALGHEVRMGSRTANNEKAAAWTQKAGARASQGTFTDAAAFGELVFNCTAGTASLEAVKAAGAQALDGKVLVDVSNPLDFSKGFPPTLSVCNTDSLGEQLQRAFPDVKVVKALNTVTASVMVEPSKLPGPTELFICGNDAGAKKQVTQVLTEGFGWKRIIDLGDITGARAMEMSLPLWIRLYQTLGTADFNFQLIRA